MVFIIAKIGNYNCAEVLSQLLSGTEKIRVGY